MTDHIDKLMGVQIADDTTYVWGGHRLDCESVADLDPADYDGTVAVYDQDDKYHAVKDGHAQKVLVQYEEDGSGNRVTTTLDAVKADLDAQGVAYVEEDVYPTQSERNDIREWGALDGTEVAEALKWGRAVDDLDAGNITLAEFKRNRNPHQGETFKPSKRTSGSSPV